MLCLTTVSTGSLDEPEVTRINDYPSGFDGHENDLDYYKNFLLKYVSKKLICTNPDLIVHRGSVEELCAGSVAKVFEDIGGEVIYFGKPHKEVYKMCLSLIHI